MFPPLDKSSVSGIGFKECYKNKLAVLIDGIQVNKIHLEDLKKNKVAAQREKDLGNLKNLP